VLENRSTAPKPFVFVLMPFDHAFDDIYEYGIRHAADEAGAYADRLDKQLFDESMLERIFNQISKADVIVADMTGRNENVFYEVGYAHALGKIVILLTQEASDIPFDLKHRPHIVYGNGGGKIDRLKTLLVPRLTWALQEATRRSRGLPTEAFTLLLLSAKITAGSPSQEISGVVTKRHFNLPLYIRNDSAQPTSALTHIYLLTNSEPTIVPHKYGSVSPSSGSVESKIEELPAFNIATSKDDTNFARQYRLNVQVPTIPAGAFEEMSIMLKFKDDAADYASQEFALRIHSGTGIHEFRFTLSFVSEAAISTKGRIESKQKSPPRSVRAGTNRKRSKSLQ
jgi:nucleoside 2-deoxyribosyltransferase